MTTLYDQIEQEEEELEEEVNENEKQEQSEEQLDEQSDKDVEELESEADNSDGAEDGDEPEEGSEKSASDDKDEQSKSEQKAEDSLTPADYARMRREKKAAEQKLKDAELSKEQTRQQEEPDEDAELRQFIEERKQEKVIEAATKEFQSYEDDFRAGIDDYDEVTNAYVNGVAQSLQLINPNLKGAELGEAVKMNILHQAAAYQAKGLDPAEELYERAKQLMQPARQAQSNQQEEQQQQKAPKRDIKKVAQNRKKAASPLSGRGKSSNVTLTLDEVANMSPAELLKVDAQTLAKLEAEAGI